MDWNEYRRILDQKISDAWHNYEHAEKQYNAAMSQYEAVMREKEAFEKAVNEMMDAAGRSDHV